MQPSPPNPDNEQSGVQQDISDGSSNHGLMQGADVGRDSNQISGDGNRISQSQNTQNFFIIPTPEPSRLPFKGRKTFRFLRERPKVLVSLALIPILGVTAFSIPQVQRELEVRRCFDIASKERKPIIAIADFATNDEKHNKDTSFEDSLRQFLIQSNIEEYAAVCRLNQEILNDVQAKEVDQSRQVKASLVIWANLKGTVCQGGIVVADWKKPLFFTKNSSEQTLNHKFFTKTVQELIPVLTHLTLSQIQYNSGQIAEARKTLSTLLNVNNSEELAKQNSEEWAKAYYFQGFLLEDPRNPDLDNAKTAYETAVRLNPKLYEAQLSLGQIYETEGELLKAEQTYKELTKCKDQATKSSAHVQLASLYNKKSDRIAAEEAYKEAIKSNRLKGYLARASMRLNNWNDPIGAVKDLQQALKENSKDPTIYEFLGLAYLRAGELELAQKTYQDVLCYLDEESKDSMLKNLETYVEAKLVRKEDIITIITQLKTTPLSSNRRC